MKNNLYLILFIDYLYVFFISKQIKLFVASFPANVARIIQFYSGVGTFYIIGGTILTITTFY